MQGGGGIGLHVYLYIFMNQYILDGVYLAGSIGSFIFHYLDSSAIIFQLV